MQITNKTITFKSSILSAPLSHSTSRNTPSEVSAAKQTEKNKNETLQNETEILKKEIESMKKDHSALSQITSVLLPYPPSKLSPQKTTVETTQKESKTVSVDGGQKQHQRKQIMQFIQSTMQTLSEIRKGISRTIQHRSDPNENIINLSNRSDDGRSISRNVAHLNILVHDMINLLYYEY